MKKTYAPLIVAGLVLTIAVVFYATRSSCPKPVPQVAPVPVAKGDTEGSQELYNKNGVRVTSYRPAQIATVPDDRLGNEYLDIGIADGQSPPMRVITRQYDSTAMVQMVNSRYVVVPIGGESSGQIPDVYIADLQTREVTHYPFNGRVHYLSFTNDARKIVAYDYDRQSLVVTDAQRNESQRLALKVVGLFTSASISPDDVYLAFAVTAGSYDHPAFGLYAYDLPRNVVRKIGEVPDAGILVWKDNTSFDVTTISIVNGAQREDVVGTYSVSQ
jgi:hypothetical protein